MGMTTIDSNSQTHTCPHDDESRLRAMMTLARLDHNDTQSEPAAQDAASELPRSLIAREGSELAAALRAGGWRASAGWRSTTDDGEEAWQIRFERP
jgi:hypothetical protein